MTTSVTISSPSPNHQNLRVTQEYYDEEGRISLGICHENILTDGDNERFFVYRGVRLIVEEVDK